MKSHVKYSAIERVYVTRATTAKGAQAASLLSDQTGRMMTQTNRRERTSL